MKKSLAALGLCWNFIRRQHTVNFHCHQRGIDHFVFRIARMHGDTDNAPIGSCSVKGFPLHFIGCTAVHRIGVAGTEFFQIEQGGTVPNFFIRCKTHTDFSVRKIVLYQSFAHGQNFRYARLIICAEHRCSISRDDGLSDRLF